MRRSERRQSLWSVDDIPASIACIFPLNVAGLHSPDEHGHALGRGMSVLVDSHSTDGQLRNCSLVCPERSVVQAWFGVCRGGVTCICGLAGLSVFSSAPSVSFLGFLISAIGSSMTGG